MHYGTIKYRSLNPAVSIFTEKMLSLAITAVWGALLYYAIVETKSIDCETVPIRFWLIVNYFMVFSLRIWSHVVSWTNLLSEPRRQFLYVILLSIAFVQVSFMLAWAIIGTIWLFAAISPYNDCLNGNNLIAAIITLVILFSLVLVFIGYGIYCGIIQNRHRGLSADFQCALEEIYTDKEKLSESKLESYIKANLEAIRQTKLISPEDAIIKANFTTTCNEVLDDYCGICFAGFEERDGVTNVGCCHLFHCECIIEWYRIQPSCPVCRQAFRPNLLKAIMSKPKIYN